jgi:hypothetical protein
VAKVNQVPEDAYYPVKDRQRDPIATHDVYEKLSSCQAASQGLHRAIFLALKLRSMERGTSDGSGWISTWIFLFKISACPIRLIPATSAAPTYFKSIVAGDVELVDGGLGTNNPLGW